MNGFLKKIRGVLGSRGFSAGAVTALVICVLLVFNTVIYSLTSIFGLYLYSPLERDYTITGRTDELYERLNPDGEKVTITFLRAEDEMRTHAVGGLLYQTAKAYEERYDFVNLRFINFITRMDESGRYVDLSHYTKDLRGEETILNYDTVIFSVGEGPEENYKVVTDTHTGAGYGDFFALDAGGSPYAYLGEDMFGAMISWVLNREHPVAYITKNHSEKVDYTFGNLLVCAGFYIEEIDLHDKESSDKLFGENADAAMLIISNPTSDFESGGEDSYAELERLRDYLKRGNGGKGGRLYVATDPYARRLPVLEGLLSEYGITISGAEGEYGYSRDLVLDGGGSVALDSTTFIAGFAEGDMAGRIVDNFKEFTAGKVMLSDVSRLITEGNAQPLLVSSDSSAAYREGKVVDDGGSFAVAAYSYKEESGGGTSHVFVVPSILMTNADLLVANGYSNKEFVYSLLHEVFGASCGLYGTKSVIYTTGTVENLTQRMAGIFAAVLMAIPVAIAVFGFIYTRRRKNR